jgi:hypothetical protein
LPNRVQLRLASFNRKFSIANFILGDRNLVRQARKELTGTKAQKTKKQKKKEELMLGEAIRKGERDTILTEFSALATISQKEYTQYGNALWDLIQLIDSEFQRIKKEYAAETDAEAKRVMKREIDEILIHAKKWFNMAQSNESFNIQMSDEASMTAEVSHLLDVFNMQSSVRIIQKEERAIAKIQKSKKLSNADAIRREKLRHLNKLVGELNKHLSLEDLAFKDVMNMMQLEQAETNRFLTSITIKLKQEGFPERDYMILEAKATEARKAANSFYSDLNGRINALINTIRSVA